jgi:hypothetical protein
MCAVNELSKDVNAVPTFFGITQGMLQTIYSMSCSGGSVRNEWDNLVIHRNGVGREAFVY